jgi:hypothetical protein
METNSQEWRVEIRWQGNEHTETALKALEKSGARILKPAP